MNRTVLLQTEATSSKKRVLSDFLNRATREVNGVLPLRQGYKNASEFQTAIAPSRDVLSSGRLFLRTHPKWTHSSQNGLTGDQDQDA